MTDPHSAPPKNHVTYRYRLKIAQNSSLCFGGESGKRFDFDKYD